VKYLKFIILILLANSCNTKGTSTGDDNLEVTKNQTDEVRQYAEYLLAGNTSTLKTLYLQSNIYDSINSPIDTTRFYYLKVSIFLLKRGDAYASKPLGKNLITYLKSNPKEFIKIISHSEVLDIRNVGETIGAYIANYEPERKKEISNISMILLNNSESENEKALSKEIISIINSTVFALSNGG